MTLDIFMAALVNGAVNGGLYALLGIAIVLIFSTTGVANFAQGELATFGAFAMFMLVLPLGLSLVTAWVSTVALLGILGAVVYFVILRPRPQATHLNLAVRTLGLSGLLHAIDVWRWGPNEPYKFPSLFGSGTVSLGPVALSRDQLGTLAVAFCMAALFFAFFRYTRAGLAMRAVALNREVAALQGVDVQRTNVLVWILATMLSATVGLLVAPISFLDTNLMQPYLLKAFTAAIIGGMYSFPGVVAGGLILGIAETFAATATSIHVREPLAFGVLLLVLLLRPQGLFSSSRTQRRV
jgi:branched-chain amino acid transport system permease protein